MSEKWRTGRKVGRTIYRQVGPEPSDSDELIGVMDTPILAFIVVKSFNERSGIKEDLPSVSTTTEENE